MSKYYAKILNFLIRLSLLSKIRADNLFDTTDSDVLFSAVSDYTSRSSVAYTLNEPLFIGGQRQLSEIHVAAFGAIGLFNEITDADLNQISTNAAWRQENVIVSGQLNSDTTFTPTSISVTAKRVTDTTQLTAIKNSNNAFTDVNLWEAYIFTWLIDNTQKFQIIIATTLTQDKVLVAINNNQINTSLTTFSGIYVYSKLAKDKPAQKCVYVFEKNTNVQVTDITKGISCFSEMVTLCNPDQLGDLDGRHPGVYQTSATPNLGVYGDFGYLHSCFPGQQMQGLDGDSEEFIVCNYDPDSYTESFDAVQGQCVNLVCTPPATPANTILIFDNPEHTIGQQMVYQCATGFFFENSNQPTFTITCFTDPTNPDALVYDPIDSCIEDDLGGFSDGSSAAATQPTVNVETQISALFDINIPCDPNDKTDNINNFKAAFAGVILPLQKNPNSNYKGYSVDDLTCDADRSQYTTKVSYLDVRPENEVISYDDYAVIANQYLAAFRDHILANNLPNKLAADVGGTQSNFDVLEVNVKNKNDPNAPGVTLSGQVLASKNVLQEAVIAGQPKFKNNFETETTFEEAMAVITNEIQKTFEDIIPKTLSNNEDTAREIESEIDITNDLIETMTNTIDDWTRATPELNATTNSLIFAAQITNNAIAMIEKSAAHLVQVADAGQMPSGQVDATIKKDVGNSHLQALDDLMSYLIEREDISKDVDDNNQLVIQTEKSLSNISRMQMVINLHKNGAETTTQTFGGETPRARRVGRDISKQLRVGAHMSDLAITDLKKNIEISYRNLQPHVKESEDPNMIGSRVQEVASTQILSINEDAVTSFLNRIDTANNTVEIHIPKIVLEDADARGVCGGNTQRPFYSQRHGDDSNTVVTNYLNVNRTLADGLFADGAAVKNTGGIVTNRNARMGKSKSKMASMLEFLHQQSYSHQDMYHSRSRRDTNQITDTTAEIMSTHYIFTDKCYFTYPTQANHDLIRNRGNAQQKNLSNMTTLITDAPCISTRICGERSFKNLAEPVEFIFRGKFLNKVNQYQLPNFECRYWNEKTYEFLTDGVKTHSFTWDPMTKEYEVICQAEHLTTFSIFFFDGMSNVPKYNPLWWYDLLTSILVEITMLIVLAIYSYYWYKHREPKPATPTVVSVANLGSLSAYNSKNKEFISTMKFDYKLSIVLFFSIWGLISCYLFGHFLGIAEYPLVKNFEPYVHFCIVVFNNYFMLAVFGNFVTITFYQLKFNPATSLHALARRGRIESDRHHVPHVDSQSISSSSDVTTVTSHSTISESNTQKLKKFHRLIKFLLILNFIIPAVIIAINVTLVITTSTSMFVAKKTYSKFITIKSGLSDALVPYIWPNEESMYYANMMPVLILTVCCLVLGVLFVMKHVKNEKKNEAGATTSANQAASQANTSSRIVDYQNSVYNTQPSATNSIEDHILMLEFKFIIAMTIHFALTYAIGFVAVELHQNYTTAASILYFIFVTLKWFWMFNIIYFSLHRRKDVKKFVLKNMFRRSKQSSD